MSTIVFPYHDPGEVVFKLLKQITPVLKDNFTRVFLGFSPKSEKDNRIALDFFNQDPFFKVNLNAQDSLIGDHFVSVYKSAVENSKPDEILHLCTGDRLAWAILNDKENFLNDLKKAEKQKTPTVFVRSKTAWATHPQNYYAAESMLSRASEILFGKSLDFGWCHLTIKNEVLSEVLPKIKNHDLVVIAELILSIKDSLISQEVDWLSWEDGYVFGKNKEMQEKDPAELEKRMNYVVPMMKFIFEKYRENI